MIIQTEVAYIYLDGKHPMIYQRPDLRYTCLSLVFSALLYLFQQHHIETNKTID